MSEILVVMITAILAIQFVGGIIIITALSSEPNFNELFAFVPTLFGIHDSFTRKLRNHRLNRVGIIIACAACYIFISLTAILWLIITFLMDICRIALKLFFWMFREKEDYNE